MSKKISSRGVVVKLLCLVLCLFPGFAYASSDGLAALGEVIELFAYLTGIGFLGIVFNVVYYCNPRNLWFYLSLVCSLLLTLVMIVVASSGIPIFGIGVLISLMNLYFLGLKKSVMKDKES